MLPLKEYLLKRLSDNYLTVAVAVAVRAAPDAVVAVALSVEEVGLGGEETRLGIGERKF